MDSAPATVSITVTPVNDRPVANPQSVTTAEDTAKAISLAASDVEGDALTYSVVTAPAHGTLTGTPPAVTYTPAADYNGSDTFTFKANDGKADSAPATVSITITPVNDPPMANPQSPPPRSFLYMQGTMVAAENSDPIRIRIWLTSRQIVQTLNPELKQCMPN